MSLRRLPETAESLPDLRMLAGDTPDQIASAYAAVAARLARLGIDTLLAPVVDLGGGSSEWLRSRTLSDDPDVVARMARAVIPAIQQHQVHACAKHFPGMRAVAADPHRERAIDTTPPSEWDRRDAVPFRAAVTSGVHMVMVGHQGALSKSSRINCKSLQEFCMKILFPYMARWHAVNWTRYHSLLVALGEMGHEIYVLQPPPLQSAETNYQEIAPTNLKNIHVQDVPICKTLWNMKFPLDKLVKKALFCLRSRW